VSETQREKRETVSKTEIESPFITFSVSNTSLGVLSCDWEEASDSGKERRPCQAGEKVRARINAVHYRYVILPIEFLKRVHMHSSAKSENDIERAQINCSTIPNTVFRTCGT